ncbi:MAG: alpha-hydroxy acid oxidase [Pontibacterium sp.]
MQRPNHYIKAPLNQIPPRLVSLRDYAKEAADYFRDDIYAYIAGGSGDEHTLSANTSAFAQWQIVPRVLNDVTGVKTQTKLMGLPFRHPILLAPVAFQTLAHPEGEAATAEAANVLETGMVVSTLSSLPMEQLAQQLEQPKGFQLYFQADKNYTLSLVKRAEAAGFDYIVFTVDAPIHGIRNRAQRAGFNLPDGVSAVNLYDRPELPRQSLTPDQSIVLQGMMSEAPTWDDLAWLIENTTLPVVVKGILHPDDTKRAQTLGAAGVIVSNHGGRVLDTAPPALDMLPSIRKAVGPDFTVILDGAVTRGTDVLVALALGANAVMLGRPQLYALAVAGALGVAHMLRLIREEFEVALALSGVSSMSELNEYCLRPCRP